jgi:hypothetical protein
LIDGQRVAERRVHDISCGEIREVVFVNL